MCLKVLFENKPKVQVNLNPSKSRVIKGSDQKSKKIFRHGGVYDLTPSNSLRRSIVVSDNFLTSYENKKVKFTNFVYLDKKMNSINLIRNLEKLRDNPDSILEEAINKIEEVSFQQTNSYKLKDILSYYCDDWDENQIFKFDGEKTSSHGKIDNAFRVYVKVDIVPGISTIYSFVFCDVHHLALISSFNGTPAKEIEKQTLLKTKYCRNHIRELYDALNEV